jgi:hypothetical protein
MSIALERPLSPEEWTPDSRSQSPRIGPQNPVCIEEVMKKDNREWVERRLKNSPASSPKTVSDETTELTSRGLTVLRDMNRLEEHLLDKRGDEENFDDPSGRGQANVSDRTIYLLVTRAVQNNENEKVSRFIERYVRGAGASLLNGSSSSLDTLSYFIQPLEKFLFWVGQDRRIPDETLDWVANTLASWKLDPEEYAELRAANRERYRKALIGSFQEAIASESGEFRGAQDLHRFLDGVPEKAVTFLAEPLLWRSLDRKAAALENLDEAQYTGACRVQSLALWAMNLPVEKLPGSPASGSNTNYTHLLAGNGMAEDWNGRSIDNWENRLFGHVESGNRVAPEDADTVIKALSFLEDPEVERLQKAFEMIRLVFAAARYRRDQGRYPVSVEELIPRYLDDSFSPAPERSWSIVPMTPFNLLVYRPYSEKPTGFTEALTAYTRDPKNEGRLPGTVEDLKPYTGPGVDPAVFSRYFIPIGECPVFSLVIWNDEKMAGFYKLLSKFPLENVLNRSSENQEPDKEISLPGTAFQYLHFPVPPWNPEEIHLPPSKQNSF